MGATPSGSAAALPRTVRVDRERPGSGEGMGSVRRAAARAVFLGQFAEERLPGGSAWCATAMVRSAGSRPGSGRSRSGGRRSGIAWRTSRAATRCDSRRTSCRNGPAAKGASTLCCRSSTCAASPPVTFRRRSPPISGPRLRTCRWTLPGHRDRRSVRRLEPDLANVQDPEMLPILTHRNELPVSARSRRGLVHRGMVAVRPL